jgi:hypothetical protein
VFGDNTERTGRVGSHVGYASGDANFVTLVQNLPTRLIFSTCHPGTLYPTFLRLYSKCPGHPAIKDHNLTIQVTTPPARCCIAHNAPCSVLSSGRLRDKRNTLSTSRL